jgi:phage gp36-like protein
MNYFMWEEISGKYPSLVKDYDSSKVNCIWAPLACADVDALIGAKYSVPFTPTPLFVKNLAIDMCYWQMTYKETDQALLKEYIDERVMGVLNGTITLTNPTDGSAIAPASNVFMTTSGTLTSFGMDNPVNFGVDSMWRQGFQQDRGQFFNDF